MPKNKEEKTTLKYVNLSATREFTEESIKDNELQSTS